VPGEAAGLEEAHVFTVENGQRLTATLIDYALDGKGASGGGDQRRTGKSLRLFEAQLRRTVGRILRSLPPRNAAGLLASSWSTGTVVSQLMQASVMLCP
jgi:hypothetical protein